MQCWADLDLKVVNTPRVGLVFEKDDSVDGEPDKTKKGPNQDDLGTVVDLPRAESRSIRVSWGSILDAKTAPKSIRKRSKIEAKNQDEKNRSKTILDPSWGDLGPSWVPSWADLDLKIVLSPSVALVFFEKSHF